LALLVLVDHGVHARAVLADAAGATEGHVLAGDVLQFDGHVFEHMAQPGALALAHPADEAARGLVGTAMLGQPRQRLDQAVDEFAPQAPGRPCLEGLQVEQQADDRKMRVLRRADVDVAFEYAHGASFLSVAASTPWPTRGAAPAGASRRRYVSIPASCHGQWADRQ